MSYTGNRLSAEEGRDHLYTTAWMTTRLRDLAAPDAFARAYHRAGAALRPRRAPRFLGPYLVLHMRLLDENTFDFYSRVPQARPPLRSCPHPVPSFRSCCFVILVPCLPPHRCTLHALTIGCLLSCSPLVACLVYVGYGF